MKLEMDFFFTSIDGEIHPKPYDFGCIFKDDDNEEALHLFGILQRTQLGNQRTKLA